MLISRYGMLNAKAILLCILLTKIHSPPPIELPKFYVETIDLLDHGPLEVGQFLSPVSENWLEEFEPLRTTASTGQTLRDTTASLQSSQPVLQERISRSDTRAVNQEKSDTMLTPFPISNKESAHPLTMALEPESPGWSFDVSGLEELNNLIEAGQTSDNRLQSGSTAEASSTFQDTSDIRGSSRTNIPEINEIPTKGQAVGFAGSLSHGRNGNDIIPRLTLDTSTGPDRDSGTQVVPGKNTEISDETLNWDDTNADDATYQSKDTWTETSRDPLLNDFMKKNSKLLKDESIWSAILGVFDKPEGSTDQLPADSTNSASESTKDGSVTTDANQQMRVSTDQTLNPSQTVSKSTHTTDSVNKGVILPTFVEGLIDDEPTIPTGIHETQNIPESEPPVTTYDPSGQTSEIEMPEFAAGTSSGDADAIVPQSTSSGGRKRSSQTKSAPKEKKAKPPKPPVELNPARAAQRKYQKRFCDLGREVKKRMEDDPGAIFTEDEMSAYNRYTHKCKQDVINSTKWKARLKAERDASKKAKAYEQRTEESGST